MDSKHRSIIELVTGRQKEPAKLNARTHLGVGWSTPCLPTTIRKKERNSLESIIFKFIFMHALISVSAPLAAAQRLKDDDVD